MIEYEKVVTEYVDGLELKLRGVSSSTDFLHMWVHDEDDAMSILNMAESAKTFGLKNLSIRITPETFAKINKDQLLETLNQVGKASCRTEKGSVILDISFTKK